MTKKKHETLIREIMVRPSEIYLWNKFDVVTHMLSCLRSLERALCATPKKASSTLISSFAEVSWYGMFPFEPHHSMALLSETCTSEIVEIRVFDGSKEEIHDESAYNSGISAIYIGLVPDQNKGKCLRFHRICLEDINRWNRSD